MRLDEVELQRIRLMDRLVVVRLARQRIERAFGLGAATLLEVQEARDAEQLVEAELKKLPPRR